MASRARRRWKIKWGCGREICGEREIERETVGRRARPPARVVVAMGLAYSPAAVYSPIPPGTREDLLHFSPLQFLQQELLVLALQQPYKKPQGKFRSRNFILN
jgi:hypothetical protein